MQKVGLILEGGAQRGVFSSGALDYLMEQDYWFPYVVGVSCGACNAVDYVAKQIGRTKDCIITTEKAYRSISFKNAIKNRSLFDMDLIFEKFPNQYIPFDYETYFSSEIRCELVAINCLTGKATYFEEKRSKSRVMNICRASSSMPIFAPMVYVDGTPYLDGGMADSIPIVHSIQNGYRKNVMILTKPKGYRKKFSPAEARVVRTMYRNYPNLVNSILTRPQVYNRTMDLIEDLERRGHVFVIRPRGIDIHKAERNVEKLTAFYNHGYDQMEKCFDKMKEYVDLDKNKRNDCGGSK